MESSSSSSSSSHCKQSQYKYYNHKQFLNTHLKPAIKDKLCTICLNQIKQAAVITVCLHAYCTDCIRKWSNHKRKCPLCNAQFASLFVEIDFGLKTFSTQHLSAVKESGITVSSNRVRDLIGRRTDYVAQRRAIEISRVERNVVNRSTRPLPRQRSFGKSTMMPPGASNERILLWRASIYEQKMRAVPCPRRRCLGQGFLGKNGNKESLLQRIEPWIHRELHAVLGDPNPAVLVHLVTSLFISSLEETQENNYLERLHPFLLERTITFWHELRCFAESSFNLETYETVVKYVKWSK